ncbi:MULTISPECIES: hypothetical protein [Bacillus]|uniref:Uncharacterized protein n=2 Tax=Bacillus thuringiensis TaxID=1428 RepID=A0A9X6VC90_BACTU|nr:MULTISPECIES: hypothetical protein [Bacillus]MEC0046430.1 hypothetical protein [Bacillus cereus]AFV21795.1 hypothetical protein BTB_502p04900 [Bacillus thuringiensis Bt407]EEM25178.1 hypothetical protein bthur0002_58200 [Bacillus thuringiensis Bt407]ERI01028.1 hypothetical protein BTCBT_002583 [Bacillus thuringiensis T01-328]MBN6707790.1 hypothetical protein [Bacillus thuringiensis]
MELNNLFIVTKRWAKDNNCLNDNEEADLERVSKVLNTNEFIIDIDSFLRPLTTEEMKEMLRNVTKCFSTSNCKPKVEQNPPYKIHFLSDGKLLERRDE